MDMQPLFFSLSLDVTMEVICGQPVQALSPKLRTKYNGERPRYTPSVEVYGRSLEAASQWVCRAAVLGP